MPEVGGAESPGSLGRIDPSSIIGQNAPVVEGRSVAALTDAFRSGFITSDDIINRVGELGKAKRKADIAMAQAAVPQAQLAGAQATAALPNVGLAAQTQSAQLKAALWDAQLHSGGLSYVNNALNAANWPLTGFDPTKPMDEATRAEAMRRYNVLLQHTAEVSQAQDFLTKTDQTEMLPFTSKDSQGREITTLHPTIKYGGRVIDPAFRDATQQWLTDPGNLLAPTWDTRGKPLPPYKLATQSAPVTDQQPTITPNVAAPAPITVTPRAQPTAGQVLPSGDIVSKTSEPPIPPDELTKQVRSQKAYEQMNLATPFYGAMKNVMDDINKFSKEEQRKGSKQLGIKDVELVSNFIKLYDPGAVVREFKWDKIEHSQPIPDRVKNWMSEISRSGSLTPETRQELFNVGTQAFRAKEQSILPDLQMAADRATKLKYPLDQVLNPREREILSGGGTQPVSPAGDNRGTADTVKTTTGATFQRNPQTGAWFMPTAGLQSRAQQLTPRVQPKKTLPSLEVRAKQLNQQPPAQPDYLGQ